VGGLDTGLAFAPSLRGAWQPSAPWTLGVLAVGPAFGSRVVATEGTATLRHEMALVDATYDFLRGDPAVLFASAGFGAYHYAATGYAVAPFASGSSDAWAALFSIGLGLRFPLSSTAALVIEGRQLSALPRPALSFAGQCVAVVMSPGSVGTITLQLGLP
jgi:hypothetical protein